MKKALKILIVVVSVFACFHRAQAESAPSVMATIAPLHSLVSGVAGGIDSVGLIVPAEASPHGFRLKPSHIRQMSGAKAVFYIGNDFEDFLLKALRSLPRRVRKIQVGHRSGLKLLKIRRSGAWESDEHDNGHGHEHGAFDMHVWLSPQNAEKIVKTVAKELSRINPRHKKDYKRNASNLVRKLRKLDVKLKRELAGLDAPYVVFHDFQVYFERKYGLNAVGSIAVDGHTQPSAARIRDIRAKLRETGAVCVFGEPQHGGRIVETVIEGTDLKTGTLDPLGAGIEPGPGLYFEMMENMAGEVKKCLR